MYAVDPLRTDLAAAFKARPFGPHAPDVAALATALRMAPVAGKYVLIAAHDGGSWELAQLTGRRYEAPTLLGERFTDLAEAEWAVFRRRWQARTGVPLVLP
jgi:N,N-dimethylformamidase